MIAYFLSLVALTLAATTEESPSVVSLTQYVRLTKTINAATHEANYTASSPPAAPIARNQTTNLTSGTNSTTDGTRNTTSPLSNGVSQTGANVILVGAAAGTAALFI